MSEPTATATLDVAPPSGVDVEQAWREHHRLVRHAALRLTRSPDWADDVSQDVWVRACRYLPRFTPAHAGAVPGWLVAATRSVVIDHTRRRSCRPQTTGTDGQVAYDTHPDSSPSPHELAAFEWLSDDLADQIGSLPDALRQALVAVAVDDLSYRDAADLLGVPMGTLQSRVHRARQRLRRPTMVA